MIARIPSKTVLGLALGGAALVALGACQTQTANRSVDTQKAPVIQMAQIVYDVRFDSLGSLSEAQARALDEYLASIRIAYGDRIGLDDRNPSSAAVRAVRRAAVASVLAKYGLLLEPTAPVTAGDLAPGTARLVVTRATASVPDCPDWSRQSTPEFEASTTSNYGCTIRSNLAEMIADPNDLVQGKAYSGTDGETTTKAIKAFRDKQPTGSGELRAATPGGAK